MTNSRDWENGGPKPDRRGERESPLQQERNVMTRKLAIGIVVLITGVVMLNDHEALARGAGGEVASERGFRGSDLVKGSKEAGYGSRRSGLAAVLTNEARSAIPTGLHATTTTPTAPTAASRSTAFLGQSISITKR